jgi:hypothetical protein
MSMITANNMYLGMNIKQLWGKDGYSVLTLYTVGTQDYVNVQDEFYKTRL